jgi:hypothetical protein
MTMAISLNCTVLGASTVLSESDEDEKDARPRLGLLSLRMQEGGDLVTAFMLISAPEVGGDEEGVCREGSFSVCTTCSFTSSKSVGTVALDWILWFCHDSNGSLPPPIMAQFCVWVCFFYGAVEDMTGKSHREKRGDEEKSRKGKGKKTDCNSHK